jgi:hypothetical protein
MSSSEQVHTPQGRSAGASGSSRSVRPGRVGRSGQRPYTPVTGALRAVETFLLSGGQQTARRNAWAAVVADRQRARDRREAEHEMAALAGAFAGVDLGQAPRPR